MMAKKKRLSEVQSTEAKPGDALSALSFNLHDDLEKSISQIICASSDSAFSQAIRAASEVDISQAIHNASRVDVSQLVLAASQVDVTSIIRDAYEAFDRQLGSMIQQALEARKQALRDANLPEDEAEALRVILFDSDPAIALESDEAFDDIPMNNFMDLVRIYAAKERSRAAFQAQSRTPEELQSSAPKNPRKTAAEAYRRENITNERDELFRLYEELPAATADSFEGFCQAFGVWTLYPFQLANIGVFDDQPYNAVAFEAAVSLLELCHDKATELLIRRANTLGIDIGAIHSAAALKVELFKTDPKRYFHSKFGCTWPLCLGPARHELTADQQRIVTRGEEAIRRLWVEVTVGQHGGQTPSNASPPKQEDLDTELLQDVRKAVETLGVATKRQAISTTALSRIPLAAYHVPFCDAQTL